MKLNVKKNSNKNIAIRISNFTIPLTTPWGYKWILGSDAAGKPESRCEQTLCWRQVPLRHESAEKNV